MVAGVVRPPALDITNEELVRSHLHAIWLAETKLALSADIPEVLDLKGDGYPLKEEILAIISKSELVTRARTPMKRVLDQILAADGGATPIWMDDAEEFVLHVAMSAPKEFNKAFDRWRELYNSARTQLAEANTRSEITGLSGADRRKIKSAQMQASDQIAILEQGKASNGSDFYTYRYLATEGFLPGYNFPRLPLYAFIPGEGKSGTFLSRARFLAISEFGPRSLIYHEGRAYRVLKAKLTTLYAAMPRLYELAVSLPDAPLQEFLHRTKGMPKTTEAERLVVLRVGQDIFRDSLVRYWQGSCPLTGITDRALLRASHIKPWKDCQSDEDRLDVYNGLLLSALWDAAFDRGLVTFESDGHPRFSTHLSKAAAAELRWQAPIHLTDKHRGRLEWHRSEVFDKAPAVPRSEN